MALMKYKYMPQFNLLLLGGRESPLSKSDALELPSVLRLEVEVDRDTMESISTAVST